MKTVWPFLCIGMLAGCTTTRPAAGHVALLNAFAREAEPPSGEASVAEEAPVEPSTKKRAQSKAGGSRASADETRKEVVQTAQAFLGEKQIVIQGKKYLDDCSGFVHAVYAQVGIDLMQAAQPEDNAVTAMFRYAKAHGKTFENGWPMPGDLVFFRNTYRLPHRHSPEALTHIGIVESMDLDGTIYIIHRVARGVVRYTMNLNYKNQTKNPHGKRLNDYIRARKGKQPAKLTSELFVSYASLLPAKPVLVAHHDSGK